MAGDLRFRDGDGWTPLLAAADVLADPFKYKIYHSELGVASYAG
jgi:hypothetical protein